MPARRCPACDRELKGDEVRTFKKFVKRLLARWFCVIEYCNDCGAEQPLVWSASDELYAEVMGIDIEKGMGGVTCPECFNKRAKAKGISIIWRPEEDGRFDPRYYGRHRYDGRECVCGQIHETEVTAAE